MTHYVIVYAIVKCNGVERVDGVLKLCRWYETEHKCRSNFSKIR